MHIPDEFYDMFDKKTFAHLSTVLPDGQLHVTPVWVDYDAGEQEVLINTVRGRQKEQNVRQTPSVGLSMTDPNDPYRFVSVRGRVTEITTEDAVKHINMLAKRYLDQAKYPGLEDEEGERVIIHITPDDVITS